MNKTSIEDLMQRGDALARQAALAGVLENQLALVVSHLRRHQDKSSTLTLLEELKDSPFAKRSKGTPDQFKALHRLVRAALSTAQDWEEAAQIVGWARRLLAVHRRQGSQANHFRQPQRRRR